MGRVFAVLLVPELALVRWPDGQVGVAWELPAGELVEVDDVVSVEGGFLVVAHPIGNADVFAVVDVSDLEPADTRTPF